MPAARDAAQAPVSGGRRGHLRAADERQVRQLPAVHRRHGRIQQLHEGRGRARRSVDLAKVAAGQELFNLPPETPLPIKIEGLRIFPAIGCSSIQECTPRKIFSGTTVGGGGRPGRIGDYAGGVLELPVMVNEACGLPEEFFRFPRAAPARRCAACRRSSATTSRAAACARDRRAPPIWSRDKGLLTPVNSRPGGGTRRTVALAAFLRLPSLARGLLFGRPVAWLAASPRPNY